MANKYSNDEDGKNTGDLGATTSIDQTKVVNYISPYYLHPFDHPGLIFVTNPLSESGDHYFTWRRSFMNALHSKNKAGFVDGTLKKPDVASPDFQPWIQSKKMQTIREDEKVFDILMGFDEAYSTVRSQILSVDPLPKLGRAYATAVQEEKQCAVVANCAPLIEATALLTKGRESWPKKNGNGDRGQFPPCVHCGKLNHSKEYYYQVIGYPSDWRKPGKCSNKQIRPQGNNIIDGTASSASSDVALAATVDGLVHRFRV
ncbi:hypothetical protein Patl1_18391 [Pistacia atlantica]|uniref:Uncharacterized protein n=1 Tax=Pistacia atlantica TaxID=434234 RepID=A0ACC1C0Z2_9ROSI|nr:hypothetical protein Patl1_18391 [Pistacia atlantica]